jgi:hypothetical protein
MRELYSDRPKCPPDAPGRIVEIDARTDEPHNPPGAKPGPPSIRYKCDKGHEWTEAG